MNQFGIDEYMTEDGRLFDEEGNEIAQDPEDDTEDNEFNRELFQGEY